MLHLDTKLQEMPLIQRVILHSPFLVSRVIYFHRYKIISLLPFSSLLKCIVYVDLSSSPVFSKTFYVMSEDSKIKKLLQECFRKDCSFVQWFTLQGNHQSDPGTGRTIFTLQLGPTSYWVTLLHCAGSSSMAEWDAYLKINLRKWQSFDSLEKRTSGSISPHVGIQWQ